MHIIQGPGGAMQWQHRVRGKGVLGLAWGKGLKDSNPGDIWYKVPWDQCPRRGGVRPAPGPRGPEHQGATGNPRVPKNGVFGDGKKTKKTEDLGRVPPRAHLSAQSRRRTGPKGGLGDRTGTNGDSISHSTRSEVTRADGTVEPT